MNDGRLADRLLAALNFDAITNIDIRFRAYVLAAADSLELADQRIP